MHILWVANTHLQGFLEGSASPEIYDQHPWHSETSFLATEPLYSSSQPELIRDMCPQSLRQQEGRAGIRMTGVEITQETAQVLGWPDEVTKRCLGGRKPSGGQPETALQDGRQGMGKEKLLSGTSWPGHRLSPCPSGR
jgi:hypothetical protein